MNIDEYKKKKHCKAKLEAITAKCIGLTTGYHRCPNFVQQVLEHLSGCHSHITVTLQSAVVS